MATSSFDKNFVVKDSDAITRVHNQLNRKNIITVNKKDIKADSSKGISLLKQSL